MDFETVDRRGRNKEVEAAAEPWKRMEAAVASGDAEQINLASSEAGGSPVHQVVEFKKTVRGERHRWKGSVSFLMVSMPMNQGQVFLCRAVGMRSDERVFQADYVIPPIWSKEESFTAEAEKRLGTFLACSCERTGPCKFHGEVLPGPGRMGKWLEDDVNRLQRIQGAPLPEAVEIMVRAQAAQESNRIVVPGRG